jgi:hypothetical protein
MDNKVKLRNLDDEVLRYLRAASDKVGFDQLSPDVVSEIKNHTGTSGASYDDSELRKRIVTVENSMVTKTSADSLYATKKDYDTSKVVDSKIDKAKVSIQNDISNIDKNFIPKEPGAITEDLLSTELKNKVNAHGSSSSSGDSGNTGSNADVDELKVQVSRNSYDITGIKNTINTNVYLKSSPIAIEDLDDNTRSLINNARQNTTLIGINDLDESLKNRIDQQATAETQTVIDSMYKDAEDGQVLIVKKNQVNDNYTVFPKYTFANDVFIFKLDAKYLDEQIVQKNSDDDSDTATFDSGKTYAKNNGYTYIADLNREVLLQYDKTTDTWTQKDSAQDTYDKLSGSFVISYPDKAIYFCKKLRDVIQVFNPEDYVKEQDVQDTIEYFDDLDKRLDTIETGNVTNDGTYVKKANTVGQNINAIDALLKEQLGDTGSAKLNDFKRLANREQDWIEALAKETGYSTVTDSNDPNKGSIEHVKWDTEGTYVKSTSSVLDNIKALDTQVKTNTDALASAIPSGIVMLYKGTTAPTGWIICDGTNNTPSISEKYDGLIWIMKK